MKKINLSITGCLGRMGRQIMRSAKNVKGFKIVSITENEITNKKIGGLKPQLNSKNAFKDASAGNMKSILEYTEDPIVSTDIIGNTNSCILDAQLINVSKNTVRVIGWYDNEAGYSNRIVDLINRIT